MRWNTKRLNSISIHALRGEGDIIIDERCTKTIISIHALRGEGDDIVEAIHAVQTISIHALRGEGDRSNCHVPQ